MREALDSVFQGLLTAEDGGRINALKGVVAALRPSAATPDATQNLDQLTRTVQADPALAAALRDALVWALTEKQLVRLLSDSGILDNQTFIAGLWRRASQVLLPPERDLQQLKDVLALLFDRRADYRWVRAIADERWTALLNALDFAAIPPAKVQRARWQMLDALQVISFRVAAIGLEPELVRNEPDLEKYESPFLTQSEEIRDFINEHRAAAAERRAPQCEDRHIQVLLGQCAQIAAKIRRKAERRGASVSLTGLLLRVEQNMERMNLLLHQLQPRPAPEQNIERVRLFKLLVRAENRRGSLGEHCSQHLELVAQRIASHAGQTGEQYITSSRSEYLSLLRSAAGAGLLVALMAAVKIGLGRQPHAPFVEAVLYSTNYVIGFVLMFVWHLSLATKQPAMTANRIAHSMDRDEHGQRSMAGLAEIVVKTVRSQFIAVVGNLSMALPLAALLGYLVIEVSGVPLMPAAKAERLLADADPRNLRVWLWSALTGVWLFLAGLVSGYYDNRAVYGRIPERIAQLPWLVAMLGARHARRVGEYVGAHLGGLAGSIAFGVLLGSTAALGRILGVPIDTLHVTFVSANAALAWISGTAGEPLFIVDLIVGVAVIGLLNLSVSFGLALAVALKARQVQFTEGGELLRWLVQRLRHRPQDFLWPPRNAAAGEGSAPRD